MFSTPPLNLLRLIFLGICERVRHCLFRPDLFRINYYFVLLLCCSLQTEQGVQCFGFARSILSEAFRLAETAWLIGSPETSMHP